jgi:Ca2+-binding RTX toxin-like protein
VRLLGDWTDNLLDFSATTFVGKVSIDGGGGKDTIIGSAGDDNIDGGSWGDQTFCRAANGNDVLHGGTGTDQLFGGSGGDTFRVTGNVGNGFEGYDSYDGGAGKDRIVAYGGKVDIGLAAFAAEETASRPSMPPAPAGRCGCSATGPTTCSISVPPPLSAR